MSTIYLAHSAKGQTWGHHKYIAIKNGRYIYPEDLGNYKNINGESLGTAKPDNRKKSYIEKLMDSSEAARNRIDKRKSDPDRDPEFRKAEESTFRKHGRDYNDYYNKYVSPHLKELDDADKKDTTIIERNKNRAAKYAKATMTAPENKIRRKAENKKSRIGNVNEDPGTRVARMHSNRKGLPDTPEGGNVPYGNKKSDHNEDITQNGKNDGNIVKRRSDVNETKNKAYAVKNNIERTVKNTAKDVSNKATEFADKVKEEIFDKGKSVAEVAKKYGTKGKELILSLFTKKKINTKPINTNEIKVNTIQDSFKPIEVVPIGTRRRR